MTKMMSDDVISIVDNPILRTLLYDLLGHPPLIFVAELLGAEAIRVASMVHLVSQPIELHQLSSVRHYH